MAMGDFTKQEAREAIEAVDEIYNALSKPKQRDFLGHLNLVHLFLEAAERAAPDEGEIDKPKQ